MRSSRGRGRVFSTRRHLYWIEPHWSAAFGAVWVLPYRLRFYSGARATRTPEESAASTNTDVTLTGGIRKGADCGTSHLPSGVLITGAGVQPSPKQAQSLRRTLPSLAALNVGSERPPGMHVDGTCAGSDRPREPTDTTNLHIKLLTG